MARTPSVSLANRLSHLVLPKAKGLDEDPANVIVEGSLDLAMGEASELSVTLLDPVGDIVSAKGVGLGAVMKWGSIKFTLAEIEHGPINGARSTILRGRTAGWQKLKHSNEHRGPKKWRSISPSHVVINEAKAAGLKAVTQPSAKRGVVSRLPKDQKKGPNVSTLDMVDRLAGECGFVFGEVGEVFYFASPTWLARRAGYAVDAGSDFLTEYPTMLSTKDDRDAPGRVTLRVLGETPQQVLLPFTSVSLTGVPKKFRGRYLVNTVTVPLSRAEPAEIELVTPKNPKKEPREDE